VDDGRCRLQIAEMEDDRFTGAIYASGGFSATYSQCENEGGISQNRQCSRWNSQTSNINITPPLFHDSPCVWFAQTEACTPVEACIMVGYREIPRICGCNPCLLK
jgi:hypothetical protein